MSEFMGRWTDELVESGEFVDAAGLAAPVPICTSTGWADGVAAVAAEVGWSSLTNPAAVAAVFTAPGATAAVAIEDATVVGFAQALSDGHLQAHLSFLAVLPSHRRRGIARRLIRMVFAATGAQRMDLITGEADDFYKSLQHKRMSTYQIYPPDS
jgi:ribosomal protein S18 acetylase RimI-like enzyme